MMTGMIWKFNIDPNVTKVQSISVPKGSKLVHCEYMNDYIYMWFLFNYNNIGINETKYYVVYGTGDKIESNYKYFKTVVTPSNYVCHIFKIGDYEDE